MVAPGIRRASASWLSGGSTLSLDRDHDRGRHVDAARATGASGGARARPRPGRPPTARCSGTPRAPSRACRSGRRSSAVAAAAGRAHRGARPGERRGCASIVELHAGVEQPLGHRGAEPVGGRAEHQPADLSGCWRQTRCATIEPIEKPATITSRRPSTSISAATSSAQSRSENSVGLDAVAVPALVEGDDAEAPRERLDRGEPGEQPGAAQRVQQHDGRGVRRRARGVGHVGRAAAGELDHPARGDPGLRDVDPAPQQRSRARHSHGRSSFSTLVSH